MFDTKKKKVCGLDVFVGIGVDVYTNALISILKLQSFAAARFQIFFSEIKFQQFRMTKNVGSVFCEGSKAIRGNRLVFLKNHIKRSSILGNLHLEILRLIYFKRFCYLNHSYQM